MYGWYGCVCIRWPSTINFVVKLFPSHGKTLATYFNSIVVHTYEVPAGQGGGHSGRLHGRGLRVLGAADGAHQLLVEAQVREAAHRPRRVGPRDLIRTSIINYIMLANIITI